jgi:hypothetical protein
MGYRSEVALCFSKAGEATFHDYVINSLADTAQAMIDSLLAYADTHYVHPDGSHLYVWSSLKTSCDDFAALEAAFNAIDSDQYLALYIGEDGDTDSQGSYYENPFGIYVSHSFSMDTSMCISSDDDVEVTNDCAGVHKQTIAMNDHTCPSCGNDKCSKAEKSCWKCGATL